MATKFDGDGSREPSIGFTAAGDFNLAAVSQRKFGPTSVYGSVGSF
jgi:hypothetical protein